MSPILAVAAGLVLAVDRATKALVRARLADGQAVPLGPFRIRRLTNTRRRPGWLVLAMVALLTLALVEFSPYFQHRAAQLGFGGMLGGAIGNVLDTRRHGGVLDFLDLRVWPVFNLADAAIVLGLGLALWHVA